MTLLAVEALQTFYGKSHVLRDVSFTVPAGEITVLLGRNGAGKTTTLRSIMGLTPPREGAVRFKDRDITGQRTARDLPLGIGYVPEGRQIFPHLEVGENLRLAERPVAGDAGWTRERIFTYFPSCRSAGGSADGASPAASSRCSPSPARSPAIPSCSCWTSPRKAWRPGSCASSSR